MKTILALVLLILSLASHGQSDSLRLLLKAQEAKIKTLEFSELVQSMSQRSLLMPSYQSELKALVARQAYEFWKTNSSEIYVSHLNIYLALYYANKYLGNEDKSYAFNQVIGHTESVVSIQFGKNPNILYSAGSDGKVLKWDLNNLEHVPTVIYEGKHLIRSIDLSFDEKWVLIVTKEKGVVLVPLEDISSESSGTIYDPEPVQTAVFYPNELKYLTVNETGELKNKGYQIETPVIGTTKSRVSSLTIKEDDNEIYAGLAEGNVLVLGDNGTSDIKTKDFYSINAMAISHNHRLLALGRELGDAIIWDLEKKEIIRTISGHQSAVTDVDFHPNNNLLLTSSRDGTAKIWDIYESKKLPLVLDDHLSWVLTASFDPTGEQIITGAADNFIRVWPLNPDVLANRICELVSRNLTQEEWDEFIGDRAPFKETCQQR